MNSHRLTDAEISEELKSIPRWSIAGGKLRRELEFPDFRSAFGFMTSAALLSERMNHHPDWFNSYSKLTVELVSHDVGGLSRRDFEWARAADKVLGS